MNDQSWINAFTGVAAVVVGAGGFWSLLQWFFNKTGRKAEAARAQAEKEAADQKTKKADIDRFAQIIEIERKSYDRSWQASEERYQWMRDMYKESEARSDELENKVKELARAIAPLIAAVVSLIRGVKEPKEDEEVSITMSRNDYHGIKLAVVAASDHVQGIL